MEIARFWMVAGHGPSHRRHETQESAEREATRLARSNPGIEFYVLETVAVHRKVDVERVSLRGDGDDEMPF